MKKILSFCLAVVLIVTSITFYSASVKAEDYKCGENITWSYDGMTKTLYLSGTGDMYDYNPGTSHPTMPGWAPYDIQQLIISEGITSIGDFAFQNKSNIYAINLPKSIQRVGKMAFQGLTKISILNLPYGIRTLGEMAFCNTGSSSGMIVNIPATLSTIPPSSFSGAKISQMNYCGETYITAVKNALSSSAGPATTVNTSHAFENDTILATFGKDGSKGASICSRCKKADPEHTGEVIPMLMEPIVSPAGAVYDGKPHIPTIAVFDSKNQPANPTIVNKHGADFINAGTYIITINYAGSTKYSGLRDIEYVIEPAEKNIYVELDEKEFLYNGSVQEPSVTVKALDDGSVLDPSEYTVEKESSIDAGTYAVRVKLTGNYKGEASMDYLISKSMQDPKVKAKTKTVKYSKVKKKKQVVKKAIIVKDGIGKVTYKKVKKGSSKNLTINKKNGRITVKKGTKKGTYKIKVKVRVAGDKNHLPYYKTVTVKVKVK